MADSPDSKRAIDPSRLPTLARAVEDTIGELGNPFIGISDTPGWAEDIKQHLDSLGLLDDLSAQQQLEVAALVPTLTEIDGAVPDVTRPLARRRSQWARNGQKWNEQLTQKALQARHALQKVQKQLTRMGVTDESVTRLLAAAVESLDPAALGSLDGRIPALLNGLSKTPPVWVDDALVALYDRLRGFGVAQGEAEARAALIANEYWDTAFQVTDENSDGERSRGCDAVRKRIMRRLPAGDTRLQSRK